LGARKPVLRLVLGLIVLGGVPEILQGIAGRDPDIYDECADILGATTGGSLGWLIVTVLNSKTVLLRPGNPE
jgi:VanZ family protein